MWLAKHTHIEGWSSIHEQGFTYRSTAIPDAGWWFGTFFMIPYIGNNNPD